MPPFANFLVDRYGWQNTLFLFSGLHLLCCLLGLSFRPLQLVAEKDASEETISTTIKVTRSKSLQPSELVVKDVSHCNRRNSEWLMGNVLLVPQCSETSSSSSVGCLLKRPSLGVSSLMISVEEGAHLTLKPASDPNAPVIRPLSFCNNVFASRSSTMNISEAGQNPYRIHKSEAEGQIILDEQGLALPDQEDSPLTSILKRVLDFSFLMTPSVFLLCLANFFGDFSQYLPYIYLPNMMSLAGINKNDASYSLSTMGLTNLVARLGLALVMDLPWISDMLVVNLSFIFSGLCVICMPFCSDYLSFIIVESIYGLSVAAYITMMPIVLVDLFGPEALTTSFGLLQLSRGIGVLVGPAACGALYDYTQTYTSPFILAGSLFVLGGLINCLVHFLNYRNSKKNCCTIKMSEDEKI